MIKKVLKWLRQHYFLIVNSIAFYPVIIALCFLLLSILLLQLDYSDIGRSFKSQADWLNLKDSSTARTIIATVAGGVLSLAVFSFSMVMILLNQAAVNMSNRILDSMIGNRFHQMVLGFYIGTIVYAFFLLSTIRDHDSEIYIPSISIYVLIILTITDIFLFIYFLHYITQSVKYETIINRIHDTTYESMRENFSSIPDKTPIPELSGNITKLQTDKSGYFNGFAHKALLKFCAEHNLVIQFLHPPGHYLLKGADLLQVQSSKPITDEQAIKLLAFIDIFNSQNNINKNPYLGCKQLTEVAIKALSPGINDPGTAVLSLNRLFDLMSYRICHYPTGVLQDDDKKTRVVTPHYGVKEYFALTILPIWNYGKKDPIVQRAMQNLLMQMHTLYKKDYNISEAEDLLHEVNSIILAANNSETTGRDSTNTAGA